MKTAAIIIVFLITNVFVFAQDSTRLVTYNNPSSVAAAKGYSHAAAVNLGNCTMLLIAGQVALDSAGNLVGEDDMAKQTEQVFRNIEQIVKANGGTMQDVVKLQYYVTDLSQIQQIRAIRDRSINVKSPPVSTLVQVSKLFRNDVLIEIEATAIIPKPRS